MTENKKVTKCIGYEYGGTSAKVAVGEKTYIDNKLSQIKVLEKFSIQTGNNDPVKTTEELTKNVIKEKVTEVGIASFGPICLNKLNQQYGFITSTPKKAWQNFPLLNEIKKHLTPENKEAFYIDTDVNACATAEFHLGNHGVKESLAYITVGTGVGVGLVINGKTVHGLLHPEGGHQMVNLHEKDKNFEGVCLFHKNCIEGLTTNVSIAKRKNCKIEDLPNLKDDDEVWEIVGSYLGQLCTNIAYLCSPEVIIIGGGVMNRSIIFKYIRETFSKTINKYLIHEKLENLENYIKPPTFSDEVGLVGAMALSDLI